MSALIHLLDDDSPYVWKSARKALEAGGKRSLSPLARASRSTAPRLRGRARLVLAELERQEIYRRLLRRAAREDIDLESSLFLLSRLERPDFDARPYLRALDAMAEEVDRRSAAVRSTFDRPLALVSYLGETMGLHGSTRDFHHPDNIFLHRAIERRSGMPLTLTAIYLFVARRVGIPAAAVALPGHVVLRLYSGDRSVLVDPFHRGKFLTRRQCEEYLLQHNWTPDPGWFRDADDSSLFRRHLTNLLKSYHRRGLLRRARSLAKAVEVATRARRAFAASSSSPPT